MNEEVTENSGEVCFPAQVGVNEDTGREDQGAGVVTIPIMGEPSPIWVV